jgi:hypothetical protein
MKTLIFLFVSSVLSLAQAADSSVEQVRAEVAKSSSVKAFVQDYQKAMEQYIVKPTCGELQGTYDRGAGLFNGTITCETLMGEGQKIQQKLSVQAAVTELDLEEESSQKAQYIVMITQLQVVVSAQE